MKEVERVFYAKYSLTDEDTQFINNILNHDADHESVDYTLLIKQLRKNFLKYASEIKSRSDNVQQFFLDIGLFSADIDFFKMIYSSVSISRKDIYEAYFQYKFFKKATIQGDTNSSSTALIKLIQAILSNNYQDLAPFVHKLESEIEYFLNFTSTTDIQLMKIPTHQLLICDVLIDYYVNMLQLEKAISMINILNNIAEKQLNPCVSIIAQAKTALIKSYQGQFLEAIQLIEESIMLASLLKNELIRIKLLQVKADIYEQFENLKMAMSLNETILHAAKIEYDRKLAELKVVRIKHKLGLPDTTVFNYEEWAEYPTLYVKLLEIITLYPVNVGISREKSVELLQDILNSPVADLYKISIWNTLILYYKMNQDFDKALQLFEKAMAFLKNHSIFSIKFSILLQGIELYLNLYFRSQELDHFAKLVFYLDELMNDTINTMPHIEALTRYIKARALWSFNKKNEALKELKNAKELAQTFRYEGLLKEITGLIDLLTKDVNVSKQQQYELLHSVLQRYGKIRVETDDKENKKPEAYLIIERASGLPVFEYNFNTKDADRTLLISGLVAAVLMYASQILSSEEVHKFNYGNYHIFLEPAEEHLHMIISKSQYEDYSKQLKTIVEKTKDTFQHNYSSGLFNDDIVFKEVSLLLKEIFK